MSEINIPASDNHEYSDNSDGPKKYNPSNKLLISALLFVSQIAYEYTSEALITSLPQYTNNMALALVSWSSLSAVIFSTSWCSINKIKSIKPNACATCMVS